MTKKILAVVLSLTVVASLASCGKSDEEKKSSKEDNMVTAEDSSVTDMKIDDEEKDDSESSAQDISTADESEIESESSVTEVEEEEKTGYDVTEAVPGTEITFERSNVFVYDLWGYEQSTLLEYPATDNENMRFYTITDMCTEYNDLTVDADDPDSWFDSLKDELAVNIQKGTVNNYFYTDGSMNVNSQELVDINGRTFLKFDITTHDTVSDKDVTFLGYLTVIKDANIEYYQDGNTVGFMIRDFADTADKAFMDEALNHAAETLVVK